MTLQCNEAMQTVWLYSTVKQFSKKYPAFPEGGMRHRIFHQDSNGLKKSGAIVRDGRKILINDQKFFAWLEAQNQGGAA